MKCSSLIILLVLSFHFVSAQKIQSPEEFLGFQVGADYKIADYETVSKYFKHLSENSKQLLYKNIGTTTLKKDMFMAVISSEENIKNIDKYREISLKLSDPRKLTEEEAKALVENGKTVVLVTCNIHSNEIASTQMSMEFAYKLITGTAPGKTCAALNDVIILLMPSINPDGTTMVVDWYNKYLGTEYDGSSMPYLYHYYSGHDNNRDWFMFNLAETKNVIKIALHDWKPQIWLDEHQMGSSGARLFIVPYDEPANPNIHPLLLRWQKLLGGYTGLELEKLNYAGVIDGAYFDVWWQGAVSQIGLFHNQISLLSEMASVNTASPIYIDPSEIKATDEITTYDIRTNYPNPWRGGWWRLRDIVNYELALTNALAEFSSLFKYDILFNCYRMAVDNINDGRDGFPFAYIVPRNQKDPVTTSKMIEILQMGGTEVHFADNEFTIGNTIYPAESYVIYTSQPYGKYVKDLFEEQKYPDMRKSKTEDPVQPYDVTGWTLPYLMDVQYFTVDKPFNLSARLLSDANYPAGFLPEENSKYVIAKSGLNINSALINKLQKENLNVFWNTEKITENEITYDEGSVIVPVDEKSIKLLKTLAEDLRISFSVLKDTDKNKIKELKKVRVGLYHSYAVNMDEGWTRLLLDNFSFDYKQMFNKDFKEKDLKKNFDVIIFPSMSPDIIKTGKSEGERARYYRPKPPEYEGGIGKEGVDNLKKFIEQDGGFAIMLDQSVDFAIEDLGLRVSNVMKKVSSKDFYCPGSLLRMKVDKGSPISYGFDDEVTVMVDDNIAFATSVPFGEYDRTVIARYPEERILKSGFLIGEDYLFQKPAIVEVKQKKGHVVLFGFPVQKRHWMYGTFKFLFNAIHMAGME